MNNNFLTKNAPSIVYLNKIVCVPLGTLKLIVKKMFIFLQIKYKNKYVKQKYSFKTGTAMVYKYILKSKYKHKATETTVKNYIIFKMF